MRDGGKRKREKEQKEGKEGKKGRLVREGGRNEETLHWGLIGCQDSITDSMDMNLSKLWEIVEDREVRHAAVHGIAKSSTGLSNRTTNLGVTDRKIRIFLFPTLEFMVIFFSLSLGY